MSEDVVFLVTVVADDTTADVILSVLPASAGESKLGFNEGFTVPSPGAFEEDRPAWIKDVLVAILEAL